MPARSHAAIRRQILGWFARERRDLPWRHTRDPWAVLVSEVMLQQTQASRVAQRFPPFLERFPTPAIMADASEPDVLTAWNGLGYNRRALNLRRAAQVVAESGWPDDLDGLLRLPGVGSYTARAVAALAFGARVGAVDTNVRRWLVRRFGLPDAASPAELQALADALATAGGGRTSRVEAASWMHASMEFGATVCAARRPRCDTCPISRGCPSRSSGRRVPGHRQAPFPGSARAERGAVVRMLVASPDKAVPMAALSAVTSRPEAVLHALERDGLAHRSGPLARLGARASGEAASTIEP